MGFVSPDAGLISILWSHFLRISLWLNFKIRKHKWYGWIFYCDQPYFSNVVKYHSVKPSNSTSTYHEQLWQKGFLKGKNSKAFIELSMIPFKQSYFQKIALYCPKNKHKQPSIDDHLAYILKKSKGRTLLGWESPGMIARPHLERNPHIILLPRFSDGWIFHHKFSMEQIHSSLFLDGRFAQQTLDTQLGSFGKEWEPLPERNRSYQGTRARARGACDESSSIDRSKVSVDWEMRLFCSEMRIDSKKSPTWPTERTPKPEYLIAGSQLTWGSVGNDPFNFWWKWHLRSREVTFFGGSDQWNEICVRWINVDVPPVWASDNSKREELELMEDLLIMIIQNI